MRAAVLGNGPSRVMFDHVPKMMYDFVIGCNVPWTKMDATVIIDIPVIEFWYEHPEKFKVPAYMSEKAWNRACELNEKFFSRYLISTFNSERVHYSSGHYAAEFAMKKGCDVIDIFGCDVWFSNRIESFSQQYEKLKMVNYEERMEKIKADRWKAYWETFKTNSAAQINFIH